MKFEIVTADSSVLYFEKEISEKNLDAIQSCYLSLQKLEGIVDLTPSYASILIQFDILKFNHQTLEHTIIKHLTNQTATQNHTQNVFKIPTNYDNNLDLEQVAQHNNLTNEEVIKLHTQQRYRVYAIGFMVGFAYLGKVDEKIFTPRLPSPRKKVAKGSVAIADFQTAIYPQDSAGGWNIIGHTEFDDFHQFSIGDIIQFERI
jgi:KipI family sensor histidine kinase inhibitor